MTAVVIGDVMLDVFEEGSVERISPEAPVPVLLNPQGVDALGGAANTARNMVGLGSRSTLIGLIGDDHDGDRCRELVRESGVTDALCRANGWRTTKKHRFLALGQQILRVDIEEPIPHYIHELVLCHLMRVVSDASVIVVSDYDKGLIRDELAKAIVSAACTSGIPVIVDTKRADPTVFAGCTIVAPNLVEATRMTGIANPAEAAERIASMTRSAVLITLGADGMLLFDRGRTCQIPSHAREVADITGAGDSVTAAVSVALAGGASFLEAAKFATDVAAVAVAHRGTYAVSCIDLDVLKKT